MIIFSDIDGVITDGLYYLDKDNNIIKGFSTRDMHSINAFYEEGFKFVFLTGADDRSTRNKFHKFIYNTIFNCKNKHDAVINMCNQNGVSPSDCLYIGDSVNDYKAMSICGKKYCPQNASLVIKNINGVVCVNSIGGSGVVDEVLFHAFREDYIRILAK